MGLALLNLITFAALLIEAFGPETQFIFSTDREHRFFGPAERRELN
jgi:hypothetical protein